MNGRLLLDTNFIIGYLMEKDPLVEFLKSHADDELFASIVSRLELLSFHALSEEDEGKIQSFLTGLTLIPLSEEVQNSTIMFRRATRRKLPDSIVAASAITASATLVTCDRELAAATFPGLTTINPDDLQ